MSLGSLGMYGMYFDNTYWLILIGVAISLIASARVKTTFSKYSKIRSVSGMTGKDVAEKILEEEGIYDVSVQHVGGNLTDHYDPRSRVLNLSDSTYNSPSVAAIGVAAHECGHAIQHSKAYAPLVFRNAIVPFARFGSGAAWVLIIIGLFINSNSSQLIINLGIICFSVAVLFQLVVLPVEFDASKRAVMILRQRGILQEEEIVHTRKVLSAAAMTYVASAAASILQLLRLVLLFGGRSRD